MVHETRRDGAELRRKSQSPTMTEIARNLLSGAEPLVKRGFGLDRNLDQRLKAEGLTPENCRIVQQELKGTPKLRIFVIPNVWDEAQMQRIISTMSERNYNPEVRDFTFKDTGRAAQALQLTIDLLNIENRKKDK